jgi:protocatechuate 3,4-dioxygenase beta subunit
MTDVHPERSRHFIALLAAQLAFGAVTDARACSAREPTPSASLGPHDFTTAPAQRRLWNEGDPGEPLFLELRVLDTCGEPVPGVRVRILHADQDGHHHPDRFRAHLDSDARGTVKIVTVYPGYAGGMARHIHFILAHPGYRELVTRLFFKNDPAAGDGVADALTIPLEEVRHDGSRRWAGGYEFVLAPAR